MPGDRVTQSKPKNRVVEQTFEEIKYLRHLIEEKTRVCVRLTDGTEFTGTLEYYDARFLRLTRDGDPNLFIFKHDIKYLYEVQA